MTKNISEALTILDDTIEELVAIRQMLLAEQQTDEKLAARRRGELRVVQHPHFNGEWDDS
jgi:hypothetical protein